MTPELFQELSTENRYNRIPVTRELLADLETPVSAYLKLAQGAYSYLLESVEGGEKWGRYSFIGLPCRHIVKAYGQRVEIHSDGKLVQQDQVDDPMAWIQSYVNQFKAPRLEDMPRFNGGLVGYIGYNVVRYSEKKLQKSEPKDDLGIPDILFMVSDEQVVFDNLSGKLIFVVHVDPSMPEAWSRAQSRLDHLEHQLRTARPQVDHISLRNDSVTESEFQSSLGQKGYEQAVEQIKAFTLAGDVMQVVPSQRLSIPFQAKPINLYRALRCINPSPYMYFLDLQEFQVAGASPEILARLEKGEVTVRPIAGTRRRGRTAEDDLAMEQDMLNDPKEIAEHLMLIDLGRNDVGRVAQTGTVKVTEQMVVERFSHVMHITSNVVGQLQPELQAMDVLRAVHPAGTLSGAPKIRAMEIIDSLEPVKRSLYGGAVGYLGWNGDMDMAIAIRTGLIRNGMLYVQAGGGIVADSVPALEWKETMNKARAVLRAASMVMGESV